MLPAHFTSTILCCCFFGPLLSLFNIGDIARDGMSQNREHYKARPRRQTPGGMEKKMKKRKQQKIIDMLCMSGRAASTSSLDPNNVSYSVARESGSDFLALMHCSCLLFFRSCKHWSAVRLHSIGFHDPILERLVRSWRTFFLISNKDRLIEWSSIVYVNLASLYVVLPFFIV